MATPVLIDLTTNDAAAKQGAVHAGSGVRTPAHGSSKTTNPTGRVQCTQHDTHVLDLLAKLVQGSSVAGASALTLQVFPINYMIGAVQKTFAGTNNFALTASATNYVYLDTSGAIQKSTSAWPGTDHWKVAIVTCDGSGITNITDAVWMNVPIGVVSNWWAIAAQAAVAVNNQKLDQVGQVELSDPTTLTLDVNNSGTIAVTRSLHLVDTASAAASGNLDFITASASQYGRVLILGAANASHVITIRSSENIVLLDGDFVMDALTKVILLVEWNGKFTEVSRNFFTVATLAANLDVNTKNLSNIGALGFRSQQTLTIASDAVDASNLEWFDLLNEAAAATDNLSTINGGANGRQITLQARSAGQVVTVKHNVGNIKLGNAKDYVMDDVTKVLMLRHDGTNWNEVSRSHWKASDLVATGNTNAYPIDTHVSGNLSVSTIKFEKVATAPWVFVLAKGRVGTAPTTTDIYVDCKKNGASLFSSQAEQIRIQAGTNGGTSATKSPPVQFNAGDILTFAITQVGTGTVGADLTINVDGYTQAITPPV